MVTSGKIEPSDSTDITVCTSPKPFSNLKADYAIPVGSNILELLDQVDLRLLSHLDFFVFVDDKLIPKEDYKTTFPLMGQTVSVNVMPAGGEGGGKNVMRAIAMIVVLIVSVYFPPAAGLAGWQAGVASAGIMLAGSLAVNALIPPATPRSGNMLDGGDSPFLSSYISGIKNRANPYGPVPRVFGTHRVYPPLAAVPYYESTGYDLWYRMLFAFTTGSGNGYDWRIGTTGLNAYRDFSVTIGDKDNVSNIYPNDVESQSLNLEIAADLTYYTQTTLGEVEDLLVYLTFPSGLFGIKNSDATSVGWTVYIVAQYSVHGANAWVNFPDSRSNPGGVNTIHHIIKHRFDIGFQAPNLAKAQYDVRIAKVSVIKADYTIYDDVYFTSLQGFTYEPPVNLADTSLIALKVKASGQLSGTLDTFNFILKTILPVYDGAVWGTAQTRNPAWAFCQVLRGAENKRAIAADSELNLVAIKEWADWCDANGFYYDAVIDYKTTVFEILKQIAAAGRASFAIVDGKYSVVRDMAQTTVRQHFSPRNSWGFTSSIAFTDVPHGLKCRFKNAESDYQNDEIIVYDDGYTSATATLFEAMEFPGVTDASQIWKLARYHIAVGRLRPEIYSINVDVENLVCTRGDLVRLTHDVMLVGLGQARIKAIVGNDVTLDDSIIMEALNTYGGQIRKADGTMLSVNITLDVGEQTTIELSSVAGIAVGDLIFYGKSGLESLDCIITRIEPGPDLTAKIVLADYSPAIFTADTGTIPEYDPGITLPPEIARIPPSPHITSVSTNTWPTSISENSKRKLRGEVNFWVGTGAQIEPDYFEGQAKVVDSTAIVETFPQLRPIAVQSSTLSHNALGGDVSNGERTLSPTNAIHGHPANSVRLAYDNEVVLSVIEPVHANTTETVTNTTSLAIHGDWQYAPTVAADERVMYFDVEVGVKYDFRLRAVSKHGTVSGWNYYRGITVTHTPITPDDLSGMAAITENSISVNDDTYGNEGIQIDFSGANPRMHVGDGSNNYFKYDGTNVSLSSSLSDAMIIKNGASILIESGGSIKLNDGGDVLLYANSGYTNPSQIVFFEDDDSSVLSALVAGSDTQQYWTPGATATHDLYMGLGATRWNNIYSYVETLFMASAVTGFSTSRMGVQASGGLSAFLQIIQPTEVQTFTFLADMFYPLWTGLTAQTPDLGQGASGYYWDQAYANNWGAPADFYFMDNVIIDDEVVEINDLDVIDDIQGSGTYEPITGFQLIDDDTLPSWLLSKHIKDIELKDEDGNITQTLVKGETMYTDDGRPWLSLKAMISLCMGAIRRLNNFRKILDNRTQVLDQRTQDLQDRVQTLEGEKTK